MTGSTTLVPTNKAPDTAVDSEPGSRLMTPTEASTPAVDAGRARAIAAVARRGMQLLVLAVVAFVVFALWLSSLAHARAQVGLQRRFRSELSSEHAPVGGTIPPGAPIAILRVPAIGVDEVVVEGSRSGQLREGPGHVVGSPLPGQSGNAVVAGRRTLYGGPFRHLGALHAGDDIRVTTGEGAAMYRVSSVADLAASDGSFVQDRGDNRLTLFTSDSRWGADGRLVVSASLVGRPLPATALQRTLDADGLGLTGERDAVPNVLVWLELLAAAALLTAYATSRWPAPRVWLVFAPVLALALWLFFENVVRLLPAAL